MERVNPNKGDSVVDFNYVRAINEFVDIDFLNKTLGELCGGSKPNSQTSIYRINNTQILANVREEIQSSGKKIYIVESVHKMPDNFGQLNNESGGAKSSEKKKMVKKPSSKKVKSSEENELYSLIDDSQETMGGKKKTTKGRPPKEKTTKEKK